MFEIIETDREPGLELVYTGEKILTTKHAWEVTFKKWETIREACHRSELAADGGVMTCGLCALYYYGHSEECEFCPIKEAGHPGCSGMPYEDCRKAVKIGKIKNALLAAERESAFLREVYR